MSAPTSGNPERLPLTIEQINSLPEAKGWWPVGMNDRVIRLIRAVERAHGIGGTHGVKARYVRKPDADKRISRGDDFAGDAWLDTETGETVYTVVGFDRNQQPTMIVQDGKAVSTSGVGEVGRG